MKSTKNMSFKDVYHIWLEEYVVDKAPMTPIKTGKLVKHAIDLFGDVPIKNVTKEMFLELLEVVNPLSPKGNPDKKLSNPKNLINYSKHIFKKAIALGIIDVSPISDIKPPSEAKSSLKPLKYYDDAFIETLKRAATTPTTPIMVQAYLLIMLDTAMTRQEILSLSWSDINFKESIISLRKVVVYRPDSEGGDYIRLLTSKEARQVKVFDPEAMEALKAWKLAQLDIYRRTLKAENQQPVFNNTENNFYSANAASNLLKPFKGRDDITEKVEHKTIKSTVTRNMFLQGYEIIDVMERLGYEDTRIPQRIYTDVLSPEEIERRKIENISPFMRAAAIAREKHNKVV